MKNIVHQNADGSIAFTQMVPAYVQALLAAGQTEQQILDAEAARVIPAGATRLPDQESSALPDLAHQDCWRWTGSALAIDLGLFKAKRKQDINNCRDAAIAAGQDFVYNGITYDGDAKAQENINKALNACKAAGATPTGFTWRSKDNQDIPFSLTDLLSLSSLMFQFGDQQYAKSWDLKAQIDAITDTSPAGIAAVQAITW